MVVALMRMSRGVRTIIELLLTSSSLLRDGFIQLIQSLGGVSSYNTDVRRCLKSVSGSGRTNVGKTNFDNYQLSVNLPEGSTLSILPAKRMYTREYFEANKRNPVRVVRSIEYECDDPHVLWSIVLIILTLHETLYSHAQQCVSQLPRQLVRDDPPGLRGRGHGQHQSAAPDQTLA